MKNNKEKVPIIIIASLAIVFIVLAVFMLILPKNKKGLENNPKKDIKEISKGVETSKTSAFEQQAFIHFYDALDRDSRDENRPFASSPIKLEELELGEEYSSCSGTLDFIGTHIKKWNFQTNCENEKKNLESTFISTESRDLEIVNFAKVEQGYVLATKSSTNTLGFHYLDQNYNIVWEKYLTDSSPDQSYAIPSDLIEAKDGFYAVGYLVDVAGGDFQPYINTDGNFAYLIKFDFSGNLITFLNLNVLAGKNISQGLQIDHQKDNQVIMITDDQVLTLTDDKDLKIVEFANENTNLESISNDIYLATKEKTITVNDHTEQITDAIALNEDGTIKWTVASNSLANCQEQECIINQFVSLSDFYEVVMENRVYILNKDGKLVKTLDYTEFYYDGQEVETHGRTTVVPLEDSYLVITYPTLTDIHIEQYDLKHKLISEKTYRMPNLFRLWSNSNEVKYSYQDKKLTMELIFAEPLSTVAVITLDEI